MSCGRKLSGVPAGQTADDGEGLREQHVPDPGVPAHQERRELLRLREVEAGCEPASDEVRKRPGVPVHVHETERPAEGTSERVHPNFGEVWDVQYAGGLQGV